MSSIEKIKFILNSIANNIEKEQKTEEKNSSDFCEGYNNGFDVGYKTALLYVIDLLCMDEDELQEECVFTDDVYNKQD